jgi:phenylpropionate dioxygenase-like ring-hydroxylating dioxygenase large terminal subunit
MRDAIPADGLREYWYPAIFARKVGRHRPASIRILGQTLALFRDGNGGVAAIANTCAHRGGHLSSGKCEFSGTVTCPYHGWTFDSAGKCVAVLGEGPNSRVPRASGSRVRSYPTRVLKGVVFVWMGDGDPAPMEEDVPPQFFDSSSLVQGSATQWKCNWRPAMENIYDAHVFYVHKNALRILLLPSKAILGLSKMGPTRPRPEVINGRGLVYTNDKRPTTQNQGSQRQWREDYGDLGKWPRTHVRVWLSMVMNLVAWLMPKHAKPLVTNEEWNGAHLPATFQVDYFAHVFTRMTVPIDRKHSRIFYFHSAWPKSTGRRWFNIAWFRYYQNWAMNYNFSAQDGKVVERQDYECVENLAASDVFPLALRRLILEGARDFNMPETAAVASDDRPRRRGRPAADGAARRSED